MCTFITKLRRTRWLVTATTAVVMFTVTLTVMEVYTTISSVTMAGSGHLSTTREPHHYQVRAAHCVAIPGKIFIPRLPNQTRPGKPADIPRRFLIEEADACRRGEEDVEVVVYVHSAISRVEERQQTRLTWANSTALKMVVVFMVGCAINDKEREVVSRESELYHDIVQGDYFDHYHLLSYKALSSLYWITRNCAHVPWILHADDDLLIDTFFLRKLIHDANETPERNKFHCTVVWHANVLRMGKWKVTQAEINERKYPPYCQGTIWFINTKQVFKVLNASTSVNFLWVDDVYITGYLAQEAKIGFLDIREHISHNSINNSQVGKKLAWYHIGKDRARLWLLILQHHNSTDRKSSDKRN